MVFKAVNAPPQGDVDAFSGSRFRLEQERYFDEAKRALLSKKDYHLTGAGEIPGAEYYIGVKKDTATQDAVVVGFLFKDSPEGDDLSAKLRGLRTGHLEVGVILQGDRLSDLLRPGGTNYEKDLPAAQEALTQVAMKLRVALSHNPKAAEIVHRALAAKPEIRFELPNLRELPK